MMIKLSLECLEYGFHEYATYFLLRPKDRKIPHQKSTSAVRAASDRSGGSKPKKSIDESMICALL